MSTDHLSKAELRRRLDQVRQESYHLKERLPPDSPHNALLRLSDIARYIGVTRAWLRMMTDGANPSHDMSEERQVELSRFFQAWDRGLLVKARIADEWKIVPRHAPDSQWSKVARAQGAPGKIHRLTIDLSTLGLKVK